MKLMQFLLPAKIANPISEKIKAQAQAQIAAMKPAAEETAE